MVKIQATAFFFLKIFFVSKNLKIKIIKNITKIRVRVQKNIETAFPIKLFIWFKFTHRLVKNLTSSTVFAFNTTNARKTQPTIKRTISKSQKNHNKAQVSIGLASFFSFFSTTFNFKNNFSQNFPGTTFARELKVFPSTSTSQEPSCSSVFTHKSKPEIVFAFVKISK